MSKEKGLVENQGISPDLAVIAKALRFASGKHRNQRRKDSAATPYINHPIELFYILAVEAAITDTATLVAALLHDTIEDTATTPEEIESIFGARIRSIVQEVTDDQALPRPERKRLQIAHAPTLSTEATQVKLADKIANLRDLVIAPPAHWTEERKADYRRWAQNVIENLSNPHPQLLQIFRQLLENV